MFEQITLLLSLSTKQILKSTNLQDLISALLTRSVSFTIAGHPYLYLLWPLGNFGLGSAHPHRC